MKKYFVCMMVVLAVVGFANAGWAADSDTISVTVSLTASIEVSLDKTSWNIGTIALSDVVGPEPFEATVGNTSTRLDIAASAPVGGWSLGAVAGANTVVVAVDDPAITLTAADQLLATVAAYGSKAFDLTYSAPTSDTIGAGVDQGFDITVKASAP